MNSPQRPLTSGLQPSFDQEKVLYEFDEEWQKPTPPRIEDFLPAAPLVNAAARRTCLEELVKIDLERRWRSKSGTHDVGLGRQPRLENYIARYAELGPLERLSAELISEEYRIRHYWGDRPPQAEYRRRFASQAPQLLAFLDRIDDQLARESIKEAPPVSPAKPMDAIRDTARPESVAAPASVGDLVGAIRQGQLLTVAQLEEVTTQPSSRFAEPQALAKELLQRDWLTPYQVNQLLLGRGHELVIGPYVVLKRLGEGGTATVFKARHRRMLRDVAVKLVRKDLLEDTEVVGRFKREIQVISQLSHANVVHAFDSGPVGDGLFLAMEYVEGVDLGRLVKQIGPLPVAVACEYIRQAALGLQHAHAHGLVHRDIKPNNLMVSTKDKGQSTKTDDPAVVLRTSSFGLVKILDLGLARLCRKVNDEITSPMTAGAGTNVLTPQGALLQGTPDYMAPEQALDFHAADARADVYSLGCTFFFLLRGQPPFPGGTPLQKLLKHQQSPPPAIEQMRPGLPTAVTGVLRKMLAKQPADRYQTPQEVADALASAIQGMPQPTAAEINQISRNLRPTSERAQIVPFALAVEQRGAFMAVAGSACRGLWQGFAAILRFGRRHPRLALGVGAGLMLVLRLCWLLFSGPSSLDALNAKDIPAGEERLGKETVAVMGLRNGMQVTALAIRPDGHQVALARAVRMGRDDKQGVITLWDPATRQETALQEELRYVSSMAYSPDGKQLVAAGIGFQANLGPSMVMWERINKNENKFSTLLPAGGREFLGITFSPDGKLFAYHEVPWSNSDTKIHVWDVAKNQIVASLPTAGQMTQPGAYVVHMFSSDGKRLIIGQVKPAGNPTIWKQWDIFGGKEPATLTQPWATVQPPQTVVFAPGGKGLATVVDSTVYFWEDASQPRWSTNLLHQRPVNGLAFAPDGKSLLTWDHISAYHAGRPPAVITRWEATTGKKLSETALPRVPSFIIPAHDGVHVAAIEGGKAYILRLTPPAKP
jgi:serine/threonine-protein kinase